MKNLPIALIILAAALLSGCATTQTAESQKDDSQTAPGDGTAPLFHDSMLVDWRQQWFLDGQQHTWDMTQLENGKEAPVLNQGRIGLRHMATKQFVYKNFTVEQL